MCTTHTILTIHQLWWTKDFEFSWQLETWFVWNYCSCRFSITNWVTNTSYVPLWLGVWLTHWVMGITSTFCTYYNDQLLSITSITHPVIDENELVVASPFLLCRLWLKLKIYHSVQHAICRLLCNFEYRVPDLMFWNHIPWSNTGAIIVNTMKSNYQFDQKYQNKIIRMHAKRSGLEYYFIFPY